MSLFSANPSVLMDNYSIPDHNSFNEIELRVKNVERIQYEQMKKFLENVIIGGKEVTTSQDKVDIYDSGENNVSIRVITTSPGNKVSKEIKTVILKDDAVFRNFNMRLSFAMEKKITQLPRGTPATSSLLRVRDRISYSFLNGSIRFDLTRVHHGDGDMKYEIEAEFVDVDSLRKYVSYVIAWLQFGSVAPHDAKYVINTINEKLFGKPSDDHIQVSDMVQASDLHFDHLRSGRIIGGGTGYLVTKKVDGERCFLIHMQGCWLILQPPNILRMLDITGYKDRLPLSVYDCELFIDENDGSGYLFPFDCVYYNDERLIDQIYSERLAKVLKRDSFPLTIGKYRIVKKVFGRLTSPALFASKVGIVFDTPVEVDGKVFPDDGLIFTRDGNYNNYTNKPGFAGMADVLKWKPVDKLTIDLMYDGQDRYLLTGKNNKPVQFFGDRINKFTPPVNAQEFALNIKDIVEIGVDDQGQTIIFRKRPDKVKPNAEFVVLSAWSLIQDPIGIDDMLGKNLTLVTKHQGRIKNRLFHEHNSGNLLDIGTGEGEDLYRFKDRFEKIFCVEPEKKKISVLKDRIGQSEATNITIISASISEHQRIIDTVDQQPISVISFMFSLSYCMRYRESILALIQHFKPRDVIFFTQDGAAVKQMFNGKSVINILEAEVRRVGDNEIVFKYDDRKEYAAEPLVYLEELDDMLRGAYTISLPMGKNYDSFLNTEQQKYERLFASGSFSRRSGEGNATPINSSSNASSDYLPVPEELLRIGDNEYGLFDGTDPTNFPVSRSTKADGGMVYTMSKSNISPTLSLFRIMELLFPNKKHETYIEIATKKQLINNGHLKYTISDENIAIIIQDIFKVASYHLVGADDVSTENYSTPNVIYLRRDTVSTPNGVALAKNYDYLTVFLFTPPSSLEE